jgi:hypothetical protein
MNKPYKEENTKDYSIRTFSQDLPSFELVWHRDKEDRIVRSLHETDWKFQLDNDIPRILTESELFIPKETYHRLIKGTGDLKVKVVKL